MRKILVADDSATARMIVKRCMEMIGFKEAEYREAKDGEEAMALIGKDKPDLIIADLNMPRMDGESLLQRVKANAEICALPVIIASSAVNQVRKQRLESLGAYGILAKPVSPAALRQALGDWPERNG